jgi:hypothetical protein
MRRRFDAVGSEDFPDGGGGDLDGQGGEFAVDAVVAPVRVLSGEPEDERSVRGAVRLWVPNLRPRWPGGVVVLENVILEFGFWSRAERDEMRVVGPSTRRLGRTAGR